MRYFVILSDGRRFGPADEPLLLQWLHEGRIARDMDLEEEVSGAKSKVGDLPSMKQATGPTDPFAKPPEHAGQASYYRPGAQYQGYQMDMGSGDLSASWTLSGIGLGVTLFGCVCCPLIGLFSVILPIFGLVMANKAIAKGHPTASSAKIFAIVVIVITGVLGLGMLLLNVAFFAGSSLFHPYIR